MENSPKEIYCILSEAYQKIITESASAWTVFRYRNVYAEPASYRKLFRKVKGYEVTGFKVNFSDVGKVSTGNKLIDVFTHSPIESIFLPEEIYKKVKSIHGNGCLVGTEDARNVKTKYIKIPCPVASMFVKELTEEEVRKMKSIDAFVSGIF